MFVADGLGIKNMSPVLGIAIGTLLGVILLVLLIFLNIWRSRTLFARRRVTDQSGEQKHDQLTVTPITNHCDDMNPDIIPAKYGKSLESLYNNNNQPTPLPIHGKYRRERVQRDPPPHPANNFRSPPPCLQSRNTERIDYLK